ncbi:MAG: hypothetical protein IJX16_04875 [Clostridia bacterium]|nr:hypothetical protein [Clostridia bacterium]
MLKGFDISNWQKNIVLKKDSYDFVICKATEGLNFVDTYCDNFIQKAIKDNKLFGFYHFARNNQPEAEAAFFVKNCKGYFNYGIPVLDIEDFSIYDWNDYTTRFINTVINTTGVPPIVYCSASQTHRFSESVYNKCGLWVAGYPQNYTGWISSDMPYNISPWSVYCIWQFTSSFNYTDYNGNRFTIDANLAPLTKEQWLKYAHAKESDKPISREGKLTEEEIKTLTEAVKNAAEKL